MTDYAKAPLYRGCYISHDVRRKHALLEMFYVALSRELGLSPDLVKQAVETGSIPSDSSTIKRLTGYYLEDLP